jgi:hypothetical protein
MKQIALPRQLFSYWTGVMAALSVTLILAQSAIAQSAIAQSEPAGKTAQQVLPLVNQYCGACHAAPRPDVLPKRSWPAVIKTMAQIAQDRWGRAGLSAQQLKDITAFYYGSSPQELPTLPFFEGTSNAFSSTSVGASSRLPYITNINAAKLTPGADVELLVSDGDAKKVFLLTRQGRQWKEEAIAEIEIPVHTQVVDFDSDGDLDVLVADLGQFPPLASLTGKLFLLRQVARGEFTKELIQENLGRVSDARALDLDADGDLDLAVAVFGGGDVGEVFWLENTGAKSSAQRYEKHQLLELSGAVNLSPADLNGDGKIDLATLIAQEHEMVVALINSGGGVFEKTMLARAPHPMYGSTSMSIVDLDGDQDADILFTNGDAFDAQTDPKPYHGVQWLENTGQLNFAFHEIGRFYGAAAAAAADMDRDGDVDVVASSWINFWADDRRQTLVWYENDGEQRFTAHPIATRPAGLTTLQLLDVTGDGALDIVAGALRMDLLLGKLGYEYKASRLFPASSPDQTHPRVVVFENKMKPR